MSHAKRLDQVTYRGKHLELIGEHVPRIGDKAPAFRAAATITEDFHFDHFTGKMVLLNVVPSLDTPICSNQTRIFSEEVHRIGLNRCVILTVSVDLPMAQLRWCQQYGVHNIVTVSDYKYGEFGSRYAMLIKGLGVLSRGVFVVNVQGRLIYEEIVHDLDVEPNYPKAFQALEDLDLRILK